ncbi:MAG: TerB family tellurite resistance protein [Microscillaceae bacterium]|nr:TerB family tellurite resistance protein [Microscillaceae bacterium]
MEHKFTYNQAVFGLMLLGAKADGKLQEEEKRLLVELTSEEHHLSAEEYKYVINEAKEQSDEGFQQAIYGTLNAYSSDEKIKALFWLSQVIKSDASSNNSDDQGHNTRELAAYHHALVGLNIQDEQVKEYERSRKE